MSFYIKQYRDNDNHWYETDPPLGTITTEIDYFITNQYTDTTIDTKLEKGEKYFLSVDIDRIGSGTIETGNQETGNTEKEIVIKLLKNNNSTILSSDNQYIDTIILPKQETINEEKITKSSFNFIIAPKAEYQRIAFILKRDLTKGDAELRIKLNVTKFAKLQNLITDVMKVDPNIKITQIGIHAKPGTLMCINGEPIKIGKRGVFELNSVFRLQQKDFSNTSQDSTTDTPQPETIGISFLNIINLNENDKKPKEYYTIDYRYIKTEEATQ